MEIVVSCSAPNRARRISHDASPKRLRIMASTIPIPTAAPTTRATAIVSAIPVSVFGLK